jgi:hypothetical protein
MCCWRLAISLAPIRRPVSWPCSRSSRIENPKYYLTLVQCPNTPAYFSSPIMSVGLQAWGKCIPHPPSLRCAGFHVEAGNHPVRKRHPQLHAMLLSRKNASSKVQSCQKRRIVFRLFSSPTTGWQAYSIPESFSALFRIVSLTAAKTNRILEVSVACVRLEGSPKH